MYGSIAEGGGRGAALGLGLRNCNLGLVFLCCRMWLVFICLWGNRQVAEEEQVAGLVGPWLAHGSPGNTTDAGA